MILYNNNNNHYYYYMQYSKRINDNTVDQRVAYYVE